MKISTMVCGLAWVSCFILSWGWLFERIGITLVSILLFLFYIIMGLGAGMVSLYAEELKKQQIKKAED